MTREFQDLATAKYLLLTTFRKNGDRVPTPVWVSADDHELLLFSERNAGKVKRIRNNHRVELQACDFSGKKARGPVVPGRARLLDDADSERVRRTLARKYGLIGTVTMFFSRLRGGKQRTIGIAIAAE